MRLIMYLFPLFSDLHRQLRTADNEYSSRCMVSGGPKMKPVAYPSSTATSSPTMTLIKL